MSNFNICFSCMSPMEEAFPICPCCGANCGGIENGQHQLPVGTILYGKYLVGRVLGQGGFGITYIGYELNLDIKVAIKEYFPQGFVSRLQTGRLTVSAPTGESGSWYDESLKRFLGEAKSLAKFSYLGNIVNVRDFFMDNSTAYIVMDYVEGLTAKQLLRAKGGRLPAAEALNLLYPLMESLAEIHAKSILHRDISPDNIMIRKTDNKAVLLDFGAARQVSASGEYSNTVNVKHGYAPVEQYSSHGKQGPWTDVYALCATIYKLTTGVTPKQAIDRTLDKSMGRDELQEPNSLGAGFSPSQQAAIMKGLSLDIKDRQQSMAELLRELKAGETRAEAAKPKREHAYEAKPTPMKETESADRKPFEAAPQKNGAEQEKPQILRNEKYYSRQGKDAKKKRCKNCGAEIDPKAEKCWSCGETVQNKKLRIAAICLAVYLLISWVANYDFAVTAMYDGRFSQSKAAFDKIPFSELLYREAYNYVEAEILMEQGKYVEAYDAFKSAGTDIFSNVMQWLREKIYYEGQMSYRNGAYNAARYYFENIEAWYKRTADYLLLISYKQGINKESDIYKLIEIVDFEDAGIIMAKRDSMMRQFLCGTWKDSDKVYWFHVKDEDNGGNSHSNLPGQPGAGYYYFKDGIYYSFTKSDYSDEVPVFKFYINDKDTISIFCYKDGKYYTLYREKE